ncbi:hypothetical protein HETIRDRAFT_454437 [Heterobasidion irregulare TC 32-1]|uniref:PH domain-containing protein n=1 Tax=Heterobasidion irregulare (strain TC 32-1) TaxID=747525 RepID=W4JTY1_HETIT|nr:uncharacterized protein HETIRDRAFT_454437 [Heterobasidion irregulare TC 32-1]ETW77022.1 hypothetical protein HETIRDRAFT_454437 [Heterobasidion irregulare TC 32-1]
MLHEHSDSISSQAARIRQVQDTWRTLGQHIVSLALGQEWISFSARSDHLLDPETPPRNPEAINYSSKKDPSVIAAHKGYLERKKRSTRMYRESYYVLTPTGFLLEYSSSDPTQSTSPLFSLFLPMCTLSHVSAPTEKSHKFHIEGRHDGSGTTKTGSLRICSGQHAWSFCARSHEDMMEWWNDVHMLCECYLVASEHIERSGPVAAAMRAAGYLSEEEGDDDEGSSVKEEQDDGEGEEEMPSQQQQEKAPEGRAPHAGALDDGAGPAATEEGKVEPSQSRRGAASSPGQAPVENRFTGGL